MVEDTAGKGIPQVIIYVVSSEDGEVLEYVTDNSGMIKFSVSCTAEYSLRTEHRDYYTEKINIQDLCADAAKSVTRIELKTAVILKD